MKKKIKKFATAKSSGDVIKVGKTYLPIRKDASPFVPELMTYKENRHLLSNLAHAIETNSPTLLIGETGVGKTSAVRYLAAKTNNSLRRVNANGSMTAEDFVGQLLVNEKGTYWKDGILIEAMRNGYWIVIDEINACSAEILFVLHSLLDDDRYVVLTDSPTREIVRPHPDFRVFATMNPPEKYAGTKEMNKALMSRFPITLEVQIPIETVEFGALSGADKALKADALTSLKAFVNDLRASYFKDEIDVFVSPRDVQTIVRLYAYTKSLTKAVEMSIVARGTKAEAKAIRDMARLRFAEDSEDKATLSRTVKDVPVPVATA